MPPTVAFATKPAIARDLVTAALDAGAPCAFVLADALYGSDCSATIRMRTTLAELAGVAGLRWTIEECFQRAKDDLASTTARRAPGIAGTAT